MIKRVIQEKIKEVRVNNNLSIDEMAHKLEIESYMVDQYEQGELEPTLDILMKVAYLFKVSIDYLVGLRDEKGKLLKPMV